MDSIENIRRRYEEKKMNRGPWAAPFDLFGEIIIQFQYVFRLKKNLALKVNKSLHHREWQNIY